MWDSPPIMIGGGVAHSVESVRVLTHHATGGSEGITEPRDLEVRARQTPNGTVRVAIGSCAIRNRSAQARSEAFVARMISEDIVTIPATGSGSARTDLVVARIKNPFADGEPYVKPTPAEIAAGTYKFIDTYVLPAMAGVTPGQHPTRAQVKAAIRAASLTAIPLASIALPASTGTVAQANIKDWREMAQYRSDPDWWIVNPASTVSIDNAAAFKNVVGVLVDVPEWATSANLAGHIGGGFFNAPTTAGYLRMCLGDPAAGGTFVAGEAVAFDRTIASGADRIDLMTAGKVAVPSAMRGTVQTVFLQGQRFNTSATPTTLTTASSVRLDCAFKAIPESNNLP